MQTSGASTSKNADNVECCLKSDYIEIGRAEVRKFRRIQAEKDQRKIDPSRVLDARRRNVEKLKFMRELSVINHIIPMKRGKKMTIDAFALTQVDGIMLASPRDRRD